MPRSRRRRPAYSSRRSSSNGGATTLILLAALLVVCGMGVAIQSKKRAHAAPMPPPPPAATPVVAQQPVEPAPVAKAPTSLVRTINTTVKDAERTLRSLRGKKRDASFARMQTDAMASLSKAREELGAWLDEHPNDKRANTLWDRLQRVYIALKKL